MKKNDCIVIGMSNFGMNIAKDLNKRGENVTAIDLSGDAFDIMEDFSGFMITADATDMTVLEQNGINNAKMVVITTNDDKVNIFLAHICSKIYNVPQIICRIADKDKNILLDENIKIVNPFNLCMDYFNTIIEE